MTQSQLREQKYKRINCVVISIYVLLSLLVFVYYYREGILYNYVQALLAIVMLLFPSILNKLFKTKFHVTADVCLIYYLFSFFTMIVGSFLRGYARIPGWDKLMHFASGIFITVLGYILFHLVSNTRRELKLSELRLVSYFVFFFNVAISGLWEIYEYCLYIFFGIDALNMETTLANDTLQDMIVCTVGGLLVLAYMHYQLKRKKSCFFINAYRHFLIYNGYIPEEH